MTRRDLSPRTRIYARSIVVSALLLIIEGVAACSHAGPKPDTSVLVREEEDFGVLTYNVFGFPLLERLQRPERFRLMADELRSSLRHVDVVLLQEAFIAPTRVLRKARTNAFEGACGARRGFNPTGLVLLSDHPPRGDAESFAFVKDDAGRWGLRAESELDCDALARANEPLKGVMAVTLSTPRGLVDVVNVHLDVNARARVQQKALVARFLEAYRAQRGHEHPLILAGDLNEEVCRETHELLPGSVSLQGASCGVGPTVGGLRLGMIPGAVLPAEIDSVHVCGATPTERRMRLFSSPRKGGHLSDHDAVLAFVRLPQGEASEACLPRGKNAVAAPP